jgi:hypothetical protein
MSTSRKANFPRMASKRALLTHMTDDMLSHANEVPEEEATDGLVLMI